MLNKYVILVALVVNSLSDNHDNEVELSNSNPLKYGDHKCSKPNIANGGVKPDDAEIELYQTYTVVCNDNFNMALGDKKVVGIDPVYTCILKDGSAALSPEKLPTCVSTDWIQYPLDFPKQVTANAAGKHAVDTDKVACWQKGRDGFEGGGSLDQCSFLLQNYMDVGCNKNQPEGSIFVGYNSLRVYSKEESALWGKDIIEDEQPKMKIYMGCLPADQKGTICMSVDQLPALSSKKLFVKVYSVPVPAGSQARDKRSINIPQNDEVHYRLRCDDGYSFENGILDDSVYGYCSKASVGGKEGDNEFFAYTKSAADTAIHCYSKCPVNPEKTSGFSEDSKPVFGKLFMPSLKKGQSFTVVKEGVICSEGQALEEGAPESYKIDCQGADTNAAAYSGVLSCTTCPVCHAKCPANPDNANKFKPGEDPVFKQIEIEELPKGKQISLAADKVTCEDGHSLAEDAPENFAITCSDNGLLSCGAQCPKCFAKCPANPTNPDKFKPGEGPVFKQIEIAELPKGKQITLAAAKVTCEDGHSLAEDAPENFAITCSEGGLLSCGAQCPKCFAMCADNPGKDKFTENTDMVFEQLTMPALKKGEKHTLNKVAVNCGDDMGIAEDAPSTYDITCGRTNVGFLSCTTCPKCFAQCLANPTEDKLVLPEGSGVKSLKIATNLNIKGTAKVNKEDVVCKDNYAMPNDAPASFTFSCGDSGKLTCAEAQNGCPKCEGTCSWPTATEGEDGYDFRYVDEAKREDKRAPHAIPGINHVEAYCKDDSMAILGPRFLSCITDNKMEFDIKGYPNDTKPQCQKAQVCQAPVTTGGSLNKTGNLPVGESYFFTCNQGYMFDLDTQGKLGSGKTVVEIECVKPADNKTIVNTGLPGQQCYKGCKQITDFDGKITPAAKESGGAPYSEGQVVTFTCKENHELADKGQGTITCTDGKIGTGVTPKCTKMEPATKDPNGKAYSATSSLTLLVTLLILAVWS